MRPNFAETPSPYIVLSVSKHRGNVVSELHGPMGRTDAGQKWRKYEKRIFNNYFSSLFTDYFQYFRSVAYCSPLTHLKVISNVPLGHQTAHGRSKAGVRGEEKEWARRGKGHHVHMVGNEWPLAGGAGDKGGRGINKILTI